MNDRVRRENEALENAREGKDSTKRKRRDGILNKSKNSSGGYNTHVRVDDDTPFDQVINAFGAFESLQTEIRYKGK